MAGNLKYVKIGALVTIGIGFIGLAYNNCANPGAITSSRSGAPTKGFMIPTYSPNVELRFCFHTVRHTQTYTAPNGQVQVGAIPATRSPVMVTVTPMGTDLPDPDSRVEGTFDYLTVDLNSTPSNSNLGLCPEAFTVLVKNGYGEFVVEGTAFSLNFEGPYSLSGGTGTLAVDSSQIQLNLGGIAAALAEARSEAEVVRALESARGTVSIFRSK